MVVGTCIGIDRNDRHHVGMAISPNNGNLSSAIKIPYLRRHEECRSRWHVSRIYGAISVFSQERFIGRYP